MTESKPARRMNPLNLLLRFVLEVAALVALGTTGWHMAQSLVYKYLLAAALPLLAAAVWGIFAVPGDPSRSGRAPVPVPGIVRLAIELAIFVAASWGLSWLGTEQVSLIFRLAVVAHYVLAYQRIVWLVRHS